MKPTRNQLSLALALAAAAATAPLVGCSAHGGYGYGHPGCGHYHGYSRASYSGSYRTCRAASDDALVLYSAILLTYHAAAWLVDCLD